MVNKHLRVAIIHEWFWHYTGSERVVEAIAEIFPQADIFMLFGDGKQISKYTTFIKQHKIRFSVLNKLPFIKYLYQYTYFLWPFVVESYNLNDYDLIISSSHSTAKGIIPRYNALHICYMHAPMRYAWNQRNSYFTSEYFGKLKLVIINILLPFLRVWDVVAQKRVDKLLVNSRFTGKQVSKYYRDSSFDILYPPVEIPCTQKDFSEEYETDYYITIMPFDYNKGGEAIIKAFVNNGKKLKVIGLHGKSMRKCSRLARKVRNIDCLGFVDECRKSRLLANAKALIFGGVQDWGISAVEALAVGTPVVARNAGGVVEIINDDRLGVLYEQDTLSDINDAIERFEAKSFDKKFLQSYAEQFSKRNFQQKFLRIIEKVLKRNKAI